MLKNYIKFSINKSSLSIQELTNDLEVSVAEETVNRWYKDLNKLPYVCEN